MIACWCWTLGGADAMFRLVHVRLLMGVAQMSQYQSVSLSPLEALYSILGDWSWYHGTSKFSHTQPIYGVSDRLFDPKTL
jgi:hypothetical protein